MSTPPAQIDPTTQIDPKAQIDPNADILPPADSPPGTAFKTLFTVVTFSLVGIIVGLRTVARATLPHILSPVAGTDYQNITDGFPLPRLLDWNQTQIDLLSQLRDVGGPGLWLGGGVLYAALAVVALRILNPGFRLFRASQAPETRPNMPTTLSTALEPYGLIKAGGIALLLGLPLLAFWLLSSHWDIAPGQADVTQGDVGRWGWIWTLRLALLGMAVWSGLHPMGLAGSSDKRTLNMSPRSWPRLALTGALFGMCVFVIGRYAVPGALEPILLRYQALGAFNVAYWHQVAGGYLLCMGAAWCAVGALFVLLAQPRRPRVESAALAITLAAALIVAFAAQRPFSATEQAARFDLTPAVLQAISAPYRPDRRGTGVPDTPEAARILAQRLGMMAAEQAAGKERTLLLFNDDSNPTDGQVGMQSRIINVVQNGITTDGLSPTAESAARAADFLRRRNFQSGLSWAATKHRFDADVYRFDTTAALAACLDDLRSGPHPVAHSPYIGFYRVPALQVAETVESLFFVCAATPQNLAQLDRWADPDHFAFPDRQSLRRMGDLYLRFGDVKHALIWYRKADMPRTFMARIRSEQPLFHTGRVTGFLRLNGRPLAGMQIGVVPSRLNGVPKNLEGIVHSAIYQIAGGRATAPQFGPFHPVPTALRWISASDVTDSRGAFTIDGLTEGEYHLICALPSAVHLTPPIDSRLRVVNPPLPFNVHYGNQSADLGIIDMFVH